MFRHCWSGALQGVHPKMITNITSYLVVFGALSRMVKVQGACDTPFWICKRLNNCAAPTAHAGQWWRFSGCFLGMAPGPAHKNASSKLPLPLKRHHCPARGRRNYSIAYMSKTAYRMHAPRTFTIRLRAPNTTRYEVSFLGEPTSPAGVTK